VSGTRFVLVLAFLAVAAAVWIRTGVPGLPQAGIPAPEPDTLGVRETPPEGTGARGIATTPAVLDLIDSVRVPSADTAGAWAYRTTLVEDLDGDAVPERLILASDVFVTDDGEPMWEDGHRWAVYVEEDDGKRTLVYGAFVPLGTVDAGVTVADSSPGRRIVILERGPTRARLLVAAYDGPGLSRRIDGTGADIQKWAGAER
jgi:hypothetical protein